MHKHSFLWSMMALWWAAPASAQSWRLAGNAGTNTATHFIGTTDNVGLVFKVNGWSSGRLDHLADNTFFGYKTGLGITTGTFNNAYGARALEANTTGANNSAIGSSAMFTNTTGTDNTSVGNRTLYLNTMGNANVAIGRRALYQNVAGNNLVAVGTGAMYYANSSAASNTPYNTAVGFEALRGSPPCQQHRQL